MAVLRTSLQAPGNNDAENVNNCCSRVLDLFAALQQADKVSYWNEKAALTVQSNLTQVSVMGAVKGKEQGWGRGFAQGWGQG